jgi:hypothetical protein
MAKPVPRQREDIDRPLTDNIYDDDDGIFSQCPSPYSDNGDDREQCPSPYSDNGDDCDTENGATAEDLPD